MKQGVAKVKERYNWPVTILLIIGIVLTLPVNVYVPGTRLPEYPDLSSQS